MKAVALAPGKVILFGEHAVTFGQPAVAMAINRYVRVTAELGGNSKVRVRSLDLGMISSWDPTAKSVDDSRLEPLRIATGEVLRRYGSSVGVELTIESEIPIAVGLGSSAATSVATVAALSKLLGLDLSRDEISSIAFEAERAVHARPSGIDNYISSHGGIALFKMGSQPISIEVEYDLPLVVGNTGIQRSTGELVRRVHALRAAFPSVVDSIVATMGRISELSVDLLKSKDLEALGRLMDLNQGLLATLGLSHESLDRLIRAAKEGGALGAKLTGAGGGGCMIALAPGKLGEVAEAIERAGGSPMRVSLDSAGVRSWVT